MGCQYSGLTAVQNLSRRLADGEVVVIDGGTGT